MRLRPFVKAEERSDAASATAVDHSAETLELHIRQIPRKPGLPESDQGHRCFLAVLTCHRCAHGRSASGPAPMSAPPGVPTVWMHPHRGRGAPTGGKRHGTAHRDSELNRVPTPPTATSSTAPPRHRLTPCRGGMPGDCGDARGYRGRFGLQPRPVDRRDHRLDDRTADGDHLVVARADGSHRHSLTNVIPGEGDIDAQISPDGRWVMYEHDTPQTSTVRLVRPDGSGNHAVDIPCIDPCAGIGGGPTWLTNRRIAFVVLAGPFDNGVAASAVFWTARVDGSDLRRFSEPGIEGRFE